ncbi:sulfatase [Kineosporia sp. J2-2]|uniref:Sulfatase n=1 Tax=Kineosporia corallincola TaxID=2835133 RepID=A0ABS5TEH4_9ACTN|nr:sulfatase [Kineosporia corallincola]MBT0769450.1 sulfatase [Kineosporia corallincola]
MKHPNIVFVLTDDMSLNMMKYAPAVQKMKKQGVTFQNYFVTNSLCCPSRSTIFTGKYPHHTGIKTNSLSSGGGYQVFKSKGLDRDTFATDLQKVGYRTAIMGKYMNEYQPGSTKKPTKSNPAGWDEWSLAASGYSGFDYNLNQNGKVKHYGSRARDYLTDVISRRGQDFIRRAAAADEPFLLELSVFTPHKPYVPAPRHQNLFKGLKAPRVKSYDRINKNVAAWASKKLTAAQKKKMDRQYRKRAQTMQAIDDMIVDVRAQLRRSGVADSTYLVFTSDNGYHMGEHSLISGKMTAYNTDIHVPLVVVGPDVPKGRKVTAMASNIDLRATFGDIANASTPKNVDGLSLAPLWRGQATKASARKYVLVEHTGPDYDRNDPDAGIFRSPNPPDYFALRSRKWLYVEYDNGRREYYDRVRDPSELKNIAGSLSARRLKKLHRLVVRAKKCEGQSACTTATS